jgi:hypothetical protein
VGFTTIKVTFDYSKRIGDSVEAAHEKRTKTPLTFFINGI